MNEYFLCVRACIPLKQWLFSVDGCRMCSLFTPLVCWLCAVSVLWVGLFVFVCVCVNFNLFKITSLESSQLPSSFEYISI